MDIRLIARFCGLLMAMAGAVAAAADDTLSTLDLISEDAALCLEVAHLNETWTILENGPLMERFRAIPAFQRILESRGFQQWQTIEDHVARQTGQKASAQIRALFGRSLALAIYVPPTGKPQGLLIGKASGTTAVETALATLNKLEPNEISLLRTHHGFRYQQRKKFAGAAESTFIATSDRWLAVTDQETLIQDVIDRFSKAAGRSGVAGSLRQSAAFARSRRRHKDAGAAYLHVNARPWDRILEEAPRNEHDLIYPADVWKHVAAVSACVNVERGLVCDASIELESSLMPAGWSQFVATSASDPQWARRIPPESLLAVSGSLDVSPLIQLLLSKVSPQDEAEFAKTRRFVESVLKGRDLFDSILPLLAKNFCGYVVARHDERTKRLVPDGALVFTAGSPEGTKLFKDMADALDIILVMAAATHSGKGPNVVTVQRDDNRPKRFAWLSEAAPFSVGFGLIENRLVVAGSETSLRQSYEWAANGHSNLRLVDHSERYFPNANQLIWLDAKQARELLERSGSELLQLLPPSPDDPARSTSRLEQARNVLGLVDSLFVASRIESDHIEFAFGGGLDVK